jgi:flagellar biosynthesis protein FlhA
LSAHRSGEQRSVPFAELSQFDGFMKSLTRQVESMMGRNLQPVLLCPSPLRRTLRGLLHRSMPYVAVIGLNEVPADLPVRSFAAIQTNGDR